MTTSSKVYVPEKFTLLDKVAMPFVILGLVLIVFSLTEYGQSPITHFVLGEVAMVAAILSALQARANESAHTKLVETATLTGDKLRTSLRFGDLAASSVLFWFVVATISFLVATKIPLIRLE